MKSAIAIIFIINCIVTLNAQSLDGLYFSTGLDGPSPFVSFEKNTVSLRFPAEVTIEGVAYTELKYIENAKYSFSMINGIYRVTIQSVPQPGPKGEGSPLAPKIELYLLFDNDFGYFSISWPYKYDSGLLLRVTDELYPKLPKGGGDPWLDECSDNRLLIKTSSALKEKGREYGGNNVKHLFTTSPWAEGKRDAGIGEYMEFDFSGTYSKEMDIIVISNGFFSPGNPDLYYQNNRVKKIRVEDVNGTYKQVFDVKDTPNLQSFKLNGLYSKLRITIVDVYYGIEYNDTCINYLTGIKLLFSKK
jgi:hypothetical protein